MVLNENEMKTWQKYILLVIAWLMLSPATLFARIQISPVYDSLGNLVLTYGSRQYPVGYSYDRLGRVKSMTNWTTYPNTNGMRVTKWNYSNRGVLTNKVYADGSTWDYTYTLGNKLQTRTWSRKPDGTNRLVTSYTYNNAGDLLSTTYSDGTTPGIT